jgi:GNAT superfamily N-acetyltransferase
MTIEMRTILLIVMLSGDPSMVSDSRVAPAIARGKSGAELSGLVVAEAQRSKGIGGLLVAAAEEWAFPSVAKHCVFAASWSLPQHTVLLRTWVSDW